MTELLCKDPDPSVSTEVLANKIGEPIVEFDILIPDSFVWWKQLDYFLLEYRRSFCIYASLNLRDHNYKMINSYHLIPGKRYHVEFRPFIMKTHSKFAYFFLKRKAKIMVGPQDISLIWELEKNKFPKDKSVIIFDHEEKLHKIKNSPSLPFIHRDESGKFWDFSLEDYDGSFDESFVLCCINEII